MNATPTLTTGGDHVAESINAAKSWRELAATPIFVATATGLTGVAAIVAGILILFGAGWAFVASGLALSAFSVVLMRGLLRG